MADWEGGSIYIGYPQVSGALSVEGRFCLFYSSFRFGTFMNQPRRLIVGHSPVGVAQRIAAIVLSHLPQTHPRLRERVCSHAEQAGSALGGKPTNRWAMTARLQKHRGIRPEPSIQMPPSTVRRGDHGLAPNDSERLFVITGEETKKPWNPI